jgi:peptide/nickel transport system permease protein
VIEPQLAASGSGAVQSEIAHYRRGGIRLISLGANAAALLIAMVVVVALLAPLVAPDNPNALDLLSGLRGPSWSHPLGQDASGRDILSRLIWGARLSLLGPSAVVVLATIVGVPVGLLAAWRGGLFDVVVSRATDGLLAFPPLLLAIVITAAFGVGFKTAIIAIAVTYVPVLARVARGLVLVEREKTYVEALRSQGFGSLAVLARHVLPNVAPGLAVQAALSFGYSLIDIAGLSFLGLGAQPPTSDWGAMLAEGRTSLLLNPTEVVVVATTVAIVVVSINVVADGLTSWAVRQR